MNDKKLKEFLQKDQSTPERPQAEWSQIAAKMERPYAKFRFISLQYFAAFTSFVLIFTYSTQYLSERQELSALQREEISSYLFEEDDYFLDSDELYAWVEVEETL